MPGKLINYFIFKDLQTYELSPMWMASADTWYLSDWTLYESESRSVLTGCLWPYGLYSPWHPPGQNTGVGSLSLLQGIFPIQGSNPGVLHCKRILYHLNHQGILCSFCKSLSWQLPPFTKYWFPFYTLSCSKLTWEFWHWLL